MAWADLQQAVAHASAAAALGDLSAAAAAYRQALAQWPEHPALLFNLGTTLADQGDAAGAADAFARVVVRAPAFAPGHHNLGNALRDAGRADQATASYRLALSLDPGLAASRIALARDLLQAGDVGQSVQLLQEGLRLQPQQAGLWTELGRACTAGGEGLRSIECHRRTLELAPDQAFAHHNLSAALHAQGHTDEALPGAQQAVALDPGQGAAWENLGNVLAHQGDLAAARPALARAAALLGRPGRPEPGIALRAALLLPAVPESRRAIGHSRAQFAEALRDHRSGPCSLTDPIQQVGLSSAFYLAYHGLPNRDLMRQQAATYRTLCPALDFTARHCLEPTDPVSRPIRVGIVSRYLRDHTIGRYLIRLVQHLARPEFQVCLLTWPSAPDRLSAAFKAAADEFLLLPQGLAEAQQVIAAAQLDVLLFADIGMEPASYFLAFARLAPVQCAFYGHPDTTGLDTIDHFLSWAPAETAASSDWYHEPLALLPADCTYACLPAPGPLPAAATKESLGLSGCQRLYLCVQAPYKVHPDFDDLVAGVMTADPSARVALVGRGLRAWNAALDRRIRARLGPLAGRFSVLPERSYSDYLALLGAADVVLDTPHFCGGATTLDAMMMGAPVITWPGAVLRSRQTLALSLRMGVTDGVALDAQDYVQRAVLLAGDAARRADVSHRMNQAQDQLFEDLGMVRAFEGLLRRWTSGRA